MGASGAGKTTLLNLLSDRIKHASNKKIDGDILINESVKLTQNNFGNFAAYVMQDDILYSTQTPREALQLSAKLRLRASDETRAQRVEELIN